MAAILEDEIEQEIIETPYPLECVEMIVYYLDIMLDNDVFELIMKERLTKIEAFIFYLERLVRVKIGSLTFF